LRIRVQIKPPLITRRKFQKKVKSIFKRSGWKICRDVSYREDNDNILKINRFINMSKDRKGAEIWIEVLGG
jgi:hypothetical protein